MRFAPTWDAQYTDEIYFAPTRMLFVPCRESQRTGEFRFAPTWDTQYTDEIYFVPIRMLFVPCRESQCTGEIYFVPTLILLVTSCETTFCPQYRILATDFAENPT
ncbi:hypothetical protein [Capnocytophaga stomatis]|uniref:hypothetical protein n=1 Tax=Capnocytophaga stomatis TaxID=1848904 RepID=UPI00195140B7|nr:hypothetical protein [Capnocytophaga stomatis]